MKELIILITALFLNEIKFSKADSPGNCAFNQGHHCGYKVFNTDWKWTIMNNYNEFGDHTTNSTMSAFLAIHDNYKAKTTTARYFSPLLEATSPCQRCLTFWYRYVGKWIKRFSIVKEDNSATNTGGMVLWNITKRTSFTWNYAQVPISSNVSYVIHFEVERFNKTGNAINNFVDVDDIIFTQGPCIIQPDYAITNNTPQIPPKQTEELLPTPISDSPINCSFYANSLCTWIQAKNNSMNWTLQNGPARLSRYTGPKNDHTYGTLKGYYIYIDVREKYFGKAARLESDYVSEKEGNCLTFWYHMWGTNVNTLNLYTQVGNTSQLIWSRKNAQGMDWKRAMVSLQMSEKFKIVFEAIAHGSSSLCSIALDDISLSKEDCPVSEYYCDFEYKHLCDYKSSVGNMWSVTGGKHYSLNAPVAKDHSFNTDYGHYIALNASQLDMFNSIDLKSPVLTLNVTKCLKFWYYMKLATTTELYVITSYNLDRILYNSASFSTFYGNWQVAQVTLNSTTKSMPRVLFRTMIMSDKEFVAIDDIEIRDGACPSEGECNFENGNLCTWTNGDDDDFDWELQSGATASAGTGPLSDHTFGNNDGTYLYIETSLPQKFNEVARLYSHGFQQSAVPSKCLHFWYNMIGRAVGRLTVYQSIAGLNRTLWQLRGDQGYDGNNQWRYAQVSFSSNKASYQLMFEATVGGEFGDIAIDDIVITDNLCAIIPNNADEFVDPLTIAPLITQVQSVTDQTVKPSAVTPLIPQKFPELISCKFEKDMCNWENEEADHHWIVSNTIKSSTKYLPHETFENYIYAQLDAQSETQKNVKFTLLSPIMTTSSADDYLCLTFDYYKFGPNKSNLTFYLEILENQTTTQQTVWSNAKYSTDNWDKIQIELNFPKKIFRMRLEAIINFVTVIAVKDFQLSTSKCMRKDICDFTTNNCNWLSISNSTAWKIGGPSDITNGPSTDHSSLTSNGRFAYIQYNNDGETNRKYSNLIGTQCLSFWYIISDGYLAVEYLNNINNINYHTIWQRNHTRDNRWRKGQITFNGSEEFYVAFDAYVRSTEPTSYVAVDDIILKLGQCQSPGSCNFDNDFCDFVNDVGDWGNWMIGNGEKIYQPQYVMQPASDANGNGFYAYVDYTFGILPTQSTTKFRSDIIQGNQISPKFCLVFYYVFYGDSISKLQIFLNDFGINNIKLLLQIDSQSNVEYWNRKQITFESKNDFEIIFATKNVISTATFVAIDAVSISPGIRCKYLDVKNKTKDLCDFEPAETSCKYWDLKQTNLLYGNWEVSNGINAEIDGPTFDHTTKKKKGYYLVADSNHARISTEESIKSNNPICLEFWFNSLGTNYNSLQFLLISENLTEEVIFNTTITADETWQNGQIDIRNKKNSKIVIQAEIPKYNKSRGFIAIDDIRLKTSGCLGSCSFENGMCGFTNAKSNSYVNWKLTSFQETSPFPLDHTTKTTLGNYLYIFELNNRRPCKLESPLIPAGRYCFQFWYIFENFPINIQLQKITSITETVRDVNLYNKIANQWIYEKTDIESSSSFQIAIIAQQNLGFGLDDIVLSNNFCKM